MADCKLQLEQRDKWSTECDGCGREYEEGETYLTDINSCCGGCVRTLCRSCVEAAAAMFQALDSPT